MKSNFLKNKLISLKSFFAQFNSLKFKDEYLISLKKEIKNLKKELSFRRKNSKNVEKISFLEKELSTKKKELEEYKNSFEYNKKKNIRSIAYKDFLKGFNSFFFSFLTIGLLIWIVVYIFTTGSGKLTLNKIFGDYKRATYSLKTNEDLNFDDLLSFSDIDLNSDSTSKKWGVELKYVEIEEKRYVSINKISTNSPFNYLVNVGDNSKFSDSFSNLYIQSITLTNEDNLMLSALGTMEIKEFITILDSGNKIIDSTFLGEGGGFRGSLLNTLSLIGFSILFAFPLGVGGAIYLGIYAKDNKLTKIIRTLIDMTSGIPSIIFGLAGALIFIPIANLIPGSNGGNIISGALTMTMILLPTIVKTVEESIKVIPSSLTNASLALGASRTETVFKIVLPNALPGILTSLLLSIGRVIGESAALVFAMGTTISEIASLNGSNASLAVHIWVILGGDHPQYDNACAISIVIIVIVLILTLLIKLISYKLNRFKKA